MGLQPKESPEMEFIIKALINETARTVAIIDILEKRGIIVSKEQIEKEAQSTANKLFETRRDVLISLLNLERSGH